MKWLVLATFFCLSFSFETQISFKLHNDTEEVFHYYIEHQKESIAPKETKSYDLKAGTQFFYHENESKGGFWFEVIHNHHKNKLKVSEI